MYQAWIILNEVFEEVHDLLVTICKEILLLQWCGAAIRLGLDQFTPYIRILLLEEHIESEAQAGELPISAQDFHELIPLGVRGDWPTDVELL